MVARLKYIVFPSGVKEALNSKSPVEMTSLPNNLAESDSRITGRTWPTEQNPARRIKPLKRTFFIFFLKELRKSLFSKLIQSGILTFQHTGYYAEKPDWLNKPAVGLKPEVTTAYFAYFASAYAAFLTTYFPAKAASHVMADRLRVRLLFEFAV